MLNGIFVFHNLQIKLMVLQRLCKGQTTTKKKERKDRRLSAIQKEGLIALWSFDRYIFNTNYRYFQTDISPFSPFVCTHFS